MSDRVKRATTTTKNTAREYLCGTTVRVCEKLLSSSNKSIKFYMFHLLFLFSGGSGCRFTQQKLHNSAIQSRSNCST